MNIGDRVMVVEPTSYLRWKIGTVVAIEDWMIGVRLDGDPESAILAFFHYEVEKL